MAAFRIIQDGLAVASVSGPNRDRALREAWRYADQYAQDGNVEIQEKDSSKWRQVAAIVAGEEDND